MAKRRAETLQDLVSSVAETGESLRDWCARVDYPERTFFRLTSDTTSPRMGTVTLLAGKLGVDPARVRAAIDASRAAAQTD